MTSKKYTPVTVPAYRLYRHTQHAHACLDAHTHAHTHTHTLHTVTSVRVHLLGCITLAIFLPFLGNDQALRHSHPARLVSPPSCLSVCVHVPVRTYVHMYACMCERDEPLYQCDEVYCVALGVTTIQETIDSSLVLERKTRGR